MDMDNDQPLSEQLRALTKSSNVLTSDVKAKRLLAWAAYVIDAANSALKSRFGEKATHIKTGNEYQVIGEVINATNAHDGQQMILYMRNEMLFVRERDEFHQKFNVKPHDH